MATADARTVVAVALRGLDRADVVIRKLRLHLRLQELRRDPAMSRELDEIVRDLDQWEPPGTDETPSQPINDAAT